MKLSLDKVAIALLVLAPVIACATSEAPSSVPDSGDCANGVCPDSGSATFYDAGDAETSVSHEPLRNCEGTQCPAPWATCKPTRDGEKMYPCGINLENDSNNCGACGRACPYAAPVHMASRCVNSACKFECLTVEGPDGKVEYRDCNNLIDDGCETNITEDPANCGACGHQVDVMNDPLNCGACGNACGPQTPCVNGKCGCTPPAVNCGGRCVDLKTDEGNCGACGNLCRDPANACDNWNPLGIKYGCVNGECGQAKCRSKTAADCNHDLNKAYKDQDCLGGNGCEKNWDTDTPDPNNCGGCGVTCKPGETCRRGSLGVKCYGPCPALLSACGDKCYDLLSDPKNCGGCGIECPTGGLDTHGVASCTKGFCTLDCVQGFGDCNGDMNDGCEVDLTRDPTNCGLCRNKCDADAGAPADGGTGQPCIEGKCLMVECPPGGGAH
jgi:hypothetical protein